MALLVIAVIALWWVWRLISAGTEILSEADTPPPVRQPAENPQPVTPEIRQQWMKDASTAKAKEIDGLLEETHFASAIIDTAQANADLIIALAGGDLDSIPETVPRSGAETGIGSYQSKFDQLYEECLDYLRENVAEDESDRAKVQEAARRWADSKREPVEKQVKELLEKQLGL